MPTNILISTLCTEVSENTFFKDFSFNNGTEEISEIGGYQFFSLTLVNLSDLNRKNRFK
jgi:hypothetical protein